MSFNGSADRDLRFGLLARQMDYVSQDVLISALRAWVLDRDRSLSEILTAHGVLSPECVAVLEARLLDQLNGHGDDSRQGRAVVPPDAAVRHQVHPVADANELGSLPQVPADPCVESDLLSTCAYHSASEGGRFRIVRPHAKGGLGEVFVAHDEELHREVALKEIQEHHATYPESRMRFVREAEITGGLEHPGVVPVYGLGQYADGRPFYAMRFIRGESLKKAIDRFHRADVPGRDPGERTLELRKLLDRFLAVCNTIAYAHSRGVLHRDLKPANVMLGPYGETLVVDWGLARLMAPLGTECDRASDVELKELSPPPVVSTDDSELTWAGQALGTPAYMSPEQAAGRLDLLGPASDVYSLGATLYYLVTGEAPFTGSDVGDMLGKVQRGEFEPPRKRKEHTPGALEAVCLKAMAVQPAARYESAKALAAELEHWLADEPVRAYAEPWPGRLRRWARRHKGTVGTVAGLLFLLTTVAVAWGLIEEARRNEQLAVNQKTTEAELRRQAERSQRQEEVLRRQAEAERAKAEHARQGELHAKEQLDQLLYFNRVNRAHQAWLNNEVGQANQLLGECPKPRRHWEWGYVHRLCHSELLTLKGHADAIRGVAIGPDGKWLASASWDKTVKVWDAVTGQEAQTLRGHTADVYGVAFSPGGERLASASGDRTVKVWDGATGRETRTFRGHTADVYGVAFSPDGKRIASASRDQTVKVWDAATGQEQLTLKGHRAGVYGVAFSPDGKRLASASYDQTVKVWDATAGKESFTLKGHAAGVTSVVFSPDGKRLASASYDKTIKLWSMANGQETGTLQGHTEVVHGVAFSPDGKRLASASADRTVKVWDPVAGQETYTLKGHSATVFSVSFSPDGQRLASAADDRTVKVWEAAISQPTLIFKRHADAVRGVNFSPDGRWLASASDDRTVKVWDAATGREMLTLQGHAGNVMGVVFSPDGRWLASASDDRTVKVWDAATGREMLTLQGLAGSIHGVAFSPDGQRLASACGDAAVQIWDTRTGQVMLTLRGHRSSVHGVAFSPDGQRLASASRDRTVKVWDVASGLVTRTLQGHTGDVYGVAFGPDGRLASASDDRTVKVWDTSTGRETLTIQGHSDAVRRAVFSPDGQRLASASDDRTVRVWDATTGQETLTLKGHKHWVYGVAFSPDGRRLVSASWDKTVKVWEALPWP